ncbi:MAG: GTPase [Candidatus Micrarchaeia archaeon]
MASLNAGPEYYVAEEKYRNALTHEEKIVALQEMLKFCPKHKAAHSVLAEIKTKMARLRKEQVRLATHKRGHKGEGDFVKSQGGAQVCVLGWVNAGKTALVNALTHASLASTPAPFETKQAAPAMMEHRGVQVQLVDTPSFIPANRALLFAMARSADLAVVIIDETQDISAQEEFFLKLNAKRVLVFRSRRNLIERASEIAAEIYASLGIIRVYTKAQRGKPDYKKPIVLFKGESTVRDVARVIHKDFLDNLRCARVWGSTRFAGQQVGSEYSLGDGDVVELQLK